VDEVVKILEVITARGSAVAGPSFTSLLATLLLCTPAAAQRPQPAAGRSLPVVLRPAFDRAAELPKIRSLLIAVDG
jgi:hypothetical protein